MMCSVLDTGGHQSTFHRCVKRFDVDHAMSCMKGGFRPTGGMMMCETYLQPFSRMYVMMLKSKPHLEDADRRSAKQQCQTRPMKLDWISALAVLAKGAEGIL